MSHSIGTTVTIEKSLRFVSLINALRLHSSKSLAAIAITTALSAPALAGPEGGQVVNGGGSIDHNGNTTTIHQDTDRMTIDWQSYDVNVDERVQYIQPDSSSLSLNRILSDRGSQILGRIDANGHVILMNPNGVIFGKDAVINAGGLLASGLSINPDDFLNGDFTFSALENTEGSVINRGLLNASTGGSISLLGKRVENEGLISADLGQINLAAGEGAVVTFDNEGLLGLRVTQAVLQDDLGVDPAIVNSGDISAENGQVLITASVSEDIFSDAVNRGELDLESSVVVHEDGTFTLGEGADVLNTGSISVSGDTGAGELVVLGENITSSGDISANTSGDTNNTAGSIEIHSNDTTLLTEQSATTAVAENSGQGGDVKVLGGNVGLFGEAVVDASGANGGGQVLIGGDVTGANEQVRNAEFIYLGENTEVNTNALDQGDGGKLITFASDTARIYGQLNSIGGVNGGDGGFVETSGLLGFQILNTPNIFAFDGMAGEWLIDPVDITIVDANPTGFLEPFRAGDVFTSETYQDGMFGYTSRNQMPISLLLGALSQGGSITVRTGVDSEAGAWNGGTNTGRIMFGADFDYSGCSQCVTGANTPTLILDAHGDVDFNGFDITNNGAARSLNLQIGSSTDRVASVTNSDAANTSNIILNGGDFISYSTGAFDGGDIDINTNGGNVTINSSSAALGGITANDGSLTVISSGNIIGSGIVDLTGTATFAGGTGTLDTIEFNNTENDFNRVSVTRGRTAVFRDVNAIALDGITINGILNVYAGSSITDIGAINMPNLALFTAGTAPNDVITLDNTANDFSNVLILGGNNVTLRDQNAIVLGDITVNNNLTVTANGAITDTGAITVSGATDLTATGIGSIVLNDTGNDFNTVRVNSAPSVTLNDTNSIILDGITANNNLTVTANGAITDTGAITVSGNTSLTAGASNDIILDHAGNNFGFSVGVTSAADVTLRDTNGITLGNFSVFGDLSVTSNGGISDTGSVSVNGLTTLNAGSSNDIAFDRIGHNFGSVRVVSGADVFLRDTDAITLDSIAVSDLTVIANGAIMDTGAIVVSGDAQFTAGSSNEITLDSVGNDFNVVNIISANSGTLVDQNGLIFLGADISSDLTVTTNLGDISQTGALTIGGTATFNPGTSNSVNLSVDGIDNDFDIVSIPNALEASIRDANDVVLDDVTVDDLLSVTSLTGGVSQSALSTIDVFNGTSSFMLPSGSVALTESNNNLGMIVIFQGENASFYDVDSAILGGVNISGSLTIEANGAIVDSGFNVIGGLASFDLNGTGNIFFGNASNDFGQLAITGTNLATVYDTNSIDLVNTSIASDLIVNAGQSGVGGITGSNINVLGHADFTASDSIVLTGLNNFNIVTAGDLATPADSIVIEEQDGFLIRQVATLGDMTITLDSGDLTLENDSSVYAVNGLTSVNFNTPGNLIFSAPTGSVGIGDELSGGGVNVSNANSVTISGETGGFDIAGLDASGNVFFDSTGGITDSGTIDVGGDLQISVTDSQVVLDEQYHSIGGVIDIDQSGTAAPFELWVQNADLGTVFTNSDTQALLRIQNNLNTSTASIAENGSGTFVIEGDALANSFTFDPGFTFSGTELVINGLGGNDVFNINTSGLYNLIGGDGVDQFNITDNVSFTSITGGGETDTLSYTTWTSDVVADLNDIDVDIINGSVQVNTRNTLQGSDLGSSFNITSLDGGDVDGVITFTNFDYVTGGTGADVFTFGANGEVSGVLNGGTGAGLNTIEARDGVDNTFIVTSDNTGSLQETGDATYVTNFQNIQNLTGGNQDDTFQIDSGEVSGLIDGGSSVGETNTLSYSQNAGPVSIDLGGALNGAENIQVFVGNGSSSTIIGDDDGNAWLVTATNLGTVDGVPFEGFNNIEGGDGVNEFTIQNNASISGNVTGGSNNDTFNFEGNGFIAGTLDGGAEVDADAINGLPGDNTWVIDGSGPNQVSVTGHATYVNDFQNIETLNGQGGDDTFRFLNSGVFSGTINGGLQTTNDVLDYTAQVNAITNFDEITASGIEIVRADGTGELRGQNGAANTWLITDANNLTLNGLDFEGYSNLVGGDSQDDFTIQDAVDFSGDINGGSDADLANNTLTNNNAGTNSWTLSSDNAGTVDSTTFSNVGEINGDGDDGLTRLSGDADWIITTASNGSLNSGALAFNGFETITAGAGNDSFLFSFDGTFEGAIDAGAGAGSDSVNMASRGVVDVTLGDATFNGVADVEAVTVAAGSTLNGLSAGTNTWTLDADNGGSVSNGSENLAFLGFTLLQGTAGALDQFTIVDGVDFTGSVNGGSDADLANNSLTNNNLGVNAWSLTTDNSGNVDATSFSNIGEINGDNNDGLTRLNGDADWIITSANNGSLNIGALAFNGFETITAGAGNDSFLFSFDGTFEGAIDAGTGTGSDSVNMASRGVVDATLGDATFNGVADVEAVTAAAGSTLNGLDSGTNVWNVTGTNDGTVSNASESLDFDGFTVLQGSDTAADQLTIQETASFAGDFNAGADTAQNSFSNNNDGNVWLLTAANNGDVGATSFSSVGDLNGSGTDSLEAFDQTNAWNLTSDNGGTINTTELVFTGMENLLGGSGDDSFELNIAGAYSGLIDGGGDIDGDSIDVSSQGIISYTLGSATLNGSAVQNFEDLIAAPGSNLSGLSSGTNTWVINAANEGRLSNAAEAINFQGFSNLFGTANSIDNFTIQSSASFAGVIDGGADASLLSNALTNENVGETWVLTGANAGEVGSPLTSFSNIGRIIASTGAGDTIEAIDQANTWQVTGDNSGSVQETSATELMNFENFENLTGGTGVDSFVYLADVDGNPLGSISGLIDGGNGGVQDRLNLTGIDSVLNVQIGGPINSNINVENVELIDRAAAEASNSFLYHFLATSEDDSYTWDIDGVNSGNVAPSVGDNTDNTIYFTNFGNVVGGIGEDLVNYTGEGILTSFNGGGGSGALVLNYTETSSPFDITIGETYLNVDEITINPVGVAVEDIEATLRISDFDTSANSWTIDGFNSGRVDTDGDAEADFVFTNFNQLFGGAGDDTFNFDYSVVDSSDPANYQYATITGQIDGAAGINTIEFVGDLDITADPNLVTPIFQFDGDSAAVLDNSISSLANILEVNARPDILTTIIGPNAANDWIINLIGGGSISGGYVFTGFDNVAGNASSDSFAIVGGSVTSIDGGGAADTLTADSRSNTFEINGLNSGVLNPLDIDGGTSFVSVENLVGNNADDAFTVGAAGQLSGNIDGLTGTDTITGNDSFNSWTISSNYTGSLTGISSFAGIENLIGGAGDDTFNFTDDAVVSNVTLNAGDNILNLISRTGDSVVDLALGTVEGVDTDGFALPVLNIIDIANLSDVNANETHSNTLNAIDQDNTWTISEINGGNVSGIGFSGISTLQGASGIDSFEFSGGYISGVVDGGAGIAQDALTADSGTNEWTVSAVNAGVLNTNTNFVDIEVLNGGTGADNFSVDDGQSVVSINGGTGDNEISLSAWTTNVAVNVEGGTAAGIQVSSINRFIANPLNTNTFTGGSGNQLWVLTPTLSTFNGSIGFSGFNDLVGGPLADEFRIEGGSFSGHLDGGTGGSNILIGNNDLNIWEITAADQGNLNASTTTFSNIQSLQGNAQSDNFILNGGSISGSVNGAGGPDSLQADEFANIWSVTGVNQGQVDGVASFDSIETIIGGSFDDTFTFADAASVDNVEGGADGFDEINLNAYTSAIEYNLALGSVAGMSVTNIDSVVADNGRSNSLVGDDQTNTWLISGANAGSINGSSFSGFANLTGGTDDDRFELAGGTLSGDVDGNLGNDVLIGSAGEEVFTITSSNAGDVSGIGSFQSIENLDGSAGDDSFELAGGTLTGNIQGNVGSDTLIAGNTNNTWLIERVNGGQVNGVAQFDGIENLNGNDQIDNFNFVGGSIAGDIDGAGRDDAINGDSIENTFVVTSDNSGTATNVGGIFNNIENINGNAQADVLTLQGGTLSGVFNGAGGTDTFNADNVANEFYIYSSNSGSITGLGGGTIDPNDGFVSVENLVGNAQDDRFEFIGATLDGYIDGQAGMDVLAAAAGDNTFEITSDNSGTATGIAAGFQNVESIIANTGDDTFILNGGTLAGTIDGRSGNNSLIADNVVNTFVVNGSNAGTATGLGAGTASPDDGFFLVQNLIGNAQSDTFILAGGALDGTIDGAAGMDTLVGDDVENNFVVLANDTGTATGLGAGTADPNDGFVSVENLTGNAQSDSFTLSGGILSGVIDGMDGTDTFTANNTTNEFYVTSLNGGRATGLGAGTVDSTDGFTNIETLQGNGQDDTFYLENGTLDGAIVGGGNSDFVNADNIASTVIIDGDNSGSITGVNLGFSEVENVLGNDQQDTFVVDGGSLSGFAFGGSDDDSLTVISTAGLPVNWTVDDENAGTVDGLDGGFLSFENLFGSLGNDTFTIAGVGIVQVNISAGGGDDVLNIDSITSGLLQGDEGNDLFNIAADVLLQNIEGGADNDTFVIAVDTVSVDLVGGAGEDILDITHAMDSNWVINGVDDRVQSSTGGTTSFASVENLMGGDGIDTFDVLSALTANLFGEANADVFNLSESVNGIIDGGGDDDVFNVLEVGVITQLVGGEGFDALQALHDDNNVWTIDGVSNTLQDENASLVGFDEIENLIGNARVDQFDVSAPFVGQLSGGENNDIFNLTASVDDGNALTSDVLGGAGNDTFNILAQNVDVAINGEEGSDSLIADHGFASTWIIDGSDDRVLDSAGGTVSFANIEFGIGGAGVDTFQIGSDFSGRFDGRGDNDIFLIGADVDDGNTLTRDVLGGAGDDSFELETAGLIVSIDGGADADTLDVQFDDSITWTIDGANDRLTDSAAGQTRFANIESSLGSSGVDTFNITSDVSGTLNGRASGDVFNLSANVGTVVQGGADNDTFNINATGLSLNLDGGSGTDTIVSAHDTVTTWTLDNINDRVEDEAGGVSAFVSVEMAQGGDAVDTFNVTRLFAGRIDGQGNDDIFNFDASATDGNSLTTDVLGGQGDDTFNINVAGISLTIDGGEGTADAVVATHTANNTWTIDGDNRVSDDLAGAASFDNVEIARGNDQIDQFIVSADFTGQIDGQGGNDIFTLASNVSDGNIITADILGGAGDDVFSIQVAGLQLNVDGGVDQDTLTVAHVEDSNWIIDASNNRVEDASGGEVQFTAIETNQGGSGVDVFDILAQVDGFIDGRSGNDIFNISADVLSVVRGGNGDDTFVINDSGLTLAIVGELGNDSITTAYNSDSVWTIDGVNNNVQDAASGTTTFSGVENLSGGDAIDRFDITAQFQGTIDGAANDDIFNFAAGVSDSVQGTADILGGSGDDQFNIQAVGLSLDIDAQAGNDVLAGPEASNTWLIGSSNTLNTSIAFSGVENFTGGTQVDSFVIGNGATVNEIRGAAVGATELGDDTLALIHDPDGAAVWRVEAENEGSVDGQVVGFYSIENLSGGEGSDDFVFTNTSSDISGLIDGGTSTDFFSPANDSLRLDVMLDGVIVELGPVSTSDNLHVDNIETIIASSDPLPNDANDTEALNQLINNESADFQWVIDGRNQGSLEPIVLPEEENTVNFENFGTLVAGLGEDSFLFEGNGYITGGIIGGSGNNVADYSNTVGDILITIGNGSGGGLSGFTTIIGNNDGTVDALPEATLQIANGDNLWFIENTASELTDGVNDGQFSDGSFGATDFTFVNFNNLSGGSGQDTFIVNGNATITGNLSGGGNDIAAPDILNATNATQGINVQSGGDTFAFVNVQAIEEIFANLTLAADNTIYASDVDMNTWVIDGVDAGRLNDEVNFDGFANLEGTNGLDSFIFDSTDRISGLVNGAGGINDVVDLTGLNDGSDISVDLRSTIDEDLDVLNVVGVETISANANDANRIIAQDINNVWLINGSNTGLVQRAENSTSDTTVNFENFAYFIGGSANDEFIFDINGALSGAILGGDVAGIDAFDSLDVTDLVADVRVGLGESADADINIVNLELVFANESTTNTLIADQGDNTWTIVGQNMGDINTSTSFESFANLEGRSENDAFLFTDQGRIDGYIDGAASRVGGVDLVDLSALEIVDVTIGLGDDHLRNIEEVIGNNTDANLTVDELIVDQGNTWVIDAEENAGYINGNIRFVGFNNISGSANDDVFTLRNAGSITGIIDAQAGDDTLNLDFVDAMPEISFIGGEGADQAIISGDLTGFTGNYVPRTSTALLSNAEQIEYGNEDDSVVYTLAYTGVEAVEDNITASQLVINGSVEPNLIRFLQEDQPSRNAFVVETLNADGDVIQTYANVNFMGKDNLRVNADVIDTVEIAGDIDIANTIEIEGADINVVNPDARLSSNALSLINVGGVGSVDSRLQTEINTLTISANDDVYIQEQNGIELTSFDLENAADFDIELVLAGDLTSAARMTSSGDLRIQTNTGQISLTGDNELSGELSLIASESVDVNNLSSTQLADVQTQNLNVTSIGGISDVEGTSISVSDLASLSSQGDVVLDNATHSFNRLSVIQASSVNIVDGDAFGLITEGLSADEQIALASNGMTVDAEVVSQNIILNAGDGTLQLNAALSTEGASEGFGFVDINAGSVSQSANVIAQSDIAINSSGQYQMAEEAQLQSLEGGITLAASDAVSLQSINALQSVEISSANEGISANTAMASAEGEIVLNAFSDIVLNDSVTSSTGLTIQSLDQDVIIESELVTTQGGALISAGQEIQMNADSSLQVGNGTASLMAGSDITLATISAGGDYSADENGQALVGQVTLDSTGGAIVDGNGDETNVMTQRLVADAANGIANGGRLETSIDRISAGNDGHEASGPSAIGIENDKSLVVERLHNNGDINVLLTDGDLLLDNTNYGTYDRDIVNVSVMGSVEATDANLAGGVIDANYNVGAVNLRTEVGDISVIDGNTFNVSRAQPVIAGNEATVTTVLGQSGDFRTQRRLSFYVNERLVLAGRSASRPIFAFNARPRFFANLAETQPDLASLLLESGDLLVEVEAIEAVNPAVFSAVRNYASDQVAILMPEDQRYEDDDDDEEEY